MAAICVDDVAKNFDQRGWLVGPGTGIIHRSANLGPDGNLAFQRMIVGKAGRLSATSKDYVLGSLIESWEGATGINTAINVQNENTLVIGEKMEAVKFTGTTMLEFFTNWVSDEEIKFHNTIEIPVLPATNDAALKSAIIGKCGENVPNYPAVVVAGRGVFIWGKDIETTMKMCEAIMTMIAAKLKAP